MLVTPSGIVTLVMWSISNALVSMLVTGRPSMSPGIVRAGVAGNGDGVPVGGVVKTIILLSRCRPRPGQNHEAHEGENDLFGMFSRAPGGLLSQAQCHRGCLSHIPGHFHFVVPF